jgi:hypothetical protein
VQQLPFLLSETYLFSPAVLHRYRHILGLWQPDIGPYGGLLNVVVSQAREGFCGRWGLWGFVLETEQQCLFCRAQAGLALLCV